MERRTTWESLRVVLRELAADERRPLRKYPSPEAKLVSPPFGITLAPWATRVGEMLLTRFGDQVELTIGVLRYPSGCWRGPDGAPVAPPAPYVAPIVDPDELEVVTSQHLEVRSGYDFRSELQLTNRLDRPVTLEAGKAIYGHVLDPTSGEVVGGSVGFRRGPLQGHKVAPAHTISLPFVVGTASFKQSLGFSVPPGEWAVEALLTLVGLGRRRTPSIPLTIVA